VGALREELARLNARLSAEGGPSRVPPAVVTSSSLFAAAQAEGAAARARAAELEAEAARLTVALSACSEQLRLFGALTALELLAPRGGAAAAHGFATVDPASGARVTFQLEFFADEKDGARMVEFLPGENAHLLPPFMAAPIVFAEDQCPMFLAKITEALRHEEEEVGAEEAAPPSERGEGGAASEAGAEVMDDGAGAGGSNAAPPAPGSTHTLTLGGASTTFEGTTPLAARAAAASAEAAAASAASRPHTYSRVPASSHRGALQSPPPPFPVPRAPAPSALRAGEEEGVSPAGAPPPPAASERRRRTPAGGRAAQVSPEGLVFRSATASSRRGGGGAP
jgi:hypothetical protein